MLIKTILAVILALVLGAASTAQEGTPTLTNEQRLLLTNKYLLYENARLKLEAAQTDLLTYVKSLEKEGYTLDIGTASYSSVNKK